MHDSGVRPPALFTHEFFQKLFVEEYSSLRKESSQALTAQQTILQWSLAAFAAIFATGLAFTRPSMSTEDAAAFFAIYAFVLPGGAFCALLVWFGELHRMERVGIFLRRREWAIAQATPDADRSDELLEPLLWERFIARPRSDPGRTGKLALGYIGVLCLFNGGTLAALLLFAQVLHDHEFAAHSFVWRLLGTAYALLVMSGILAFCAATSVGLRRLSRIASDTPYRQNPSSG